MADIPTTTFTDRTGKEFLIRTAQTADAENLLSYIRAVADETEFFVLESDEFPPTVEAERTWVQDHVDHPGKILLVAEAEGHIIGNISFEAGPSRRIAHRGNLGISVTRAWRGRGVGTALLQRLLKWAEANPIIEKVALEVFATNDSAIRLYKKLGFIEQGVARKEVKLGPGRHVDVLSMYRFVKQL
ncbi:MAG: GNAT family N-acetyltransferase [Planctomycetaceae bacterium]|nr:GNAT family N-acetyltransferase [Planctomycetaceae bacterium]